MKNNKALLIGAAMILVYFIAGIITLNHYGLTWDDPQEFSYAEANLNYLLTRDPSVTTHIQGYLYSPSNAGNLLGVITKRILHDWLGAMALDNSYHLAGIIIGTLTLLLIYWFANKQYGYKAATFAGLSFMLFPRIFGHIHNNVKDTTVMLAYTAVLISTFYLWKTKEKKWLFWTAASSAFALNTKLLTLFLIPTIIIWLGINCLLGRKKVKSNIRKSDLFKAAVIFLIILYILNPAYWIHPTYAAKTVFLLNHFDDSPYKSANDYYKVVMFGKLVPQGQIPVYYIPLMFLIVTPVPILVLFLIGAYFVLQDYQKTSYLMLISWLGITVLLYASLNISIYNIIRHVLFLVPAVCIIAGIGGKQLFGLIERRMTKGSSIIFSLMLVIFFALPLISMIQYHPYETTYFNELIGGINGAEGKFEIEYWGNSYKEGSAWLNEHAEKGATVVVPVTEYLPRYYLREDIKVFKKPQNIKGDFYVMFMRDKVDYNELMVSLESGKEPTHSIKVRGVAILNIYKINGGTT